MTGLRAAIEAVYRQVGAPGWAAPNLDGLIDVLRDLSWLPEGTVAIRVPDVAGADYQRLFETLLRVVDETAATARPVVLAS
jgi:Barstar (barnase inhibitor)